MTFLNKLLPILWENEKMFYALGALKIQFINSPALMPLVHKTILKSEVMKNRPGLKTVLFSLHTLGR